MGERIEHFDFDTFEQPRRPSPYPVDEWTDGSVWRIWDGTDYHGPTTSMQARLHYYASKRGLSVRTRAVQDGERKGVFFRFMQRQPRESAPPIGERPG